MSQIPDTRISLLLRLRDSADDGAWREFVEIYEPVIQRLLRQKGFQDADAEDLTQEALLAVMRTVERWDPDTNQGRFRRWLLVTTRNLMVNFLTRVRPGQQGPGGTIFLDLLGQLPDPSPEMESQFLLEHRREVFRWAAARTRQQFQDTTWQAFSRTHLERVPITDVAHALGISVGAVYTARSRVMADLKRNVALWESEGNEAGEMNLHGQ